MKINGRREPSRKEFFKWLEKYASKIEQDEKLKPTSRDTVNGRSETQKNDIVLQNKKEEAENPRKRVGHQT